MRKGRMGEDVAADHLQKRGYRIAARNYRCGLGEIDIVAEGRNQVVFVEVKTWDHYGADSLEWAIYGKKRKRILGGSRHYLMRHPEYESFGVRYDVILVSDHLKKLDHIEAAFEG